MKILAYGKDGGPDSVVWGLWLVEIKALFSIALLVFEDGRRENYHSHAFNSYSWVIKGRLIEQMLDGEQFYHYPSWKIVRTYRDTFHRVFSRGRTWVLTFRGPWAKTWKEYDPKAEKFITLESGRRVVG